LEFPQSALPDFICRFVKQIHRHDFELEFLAVFRSSFEVRIQEDVDSLEAQGFVGGHLPDFRRRSNSKPISASQYYLKKSQKLLLDFPLPLYS